MTNKLKERFFHEYVPEVLDVGFECLLPLMEHTGLTVVSTGLAKFERKPRVKVKCAVDACRAARKDFT